jgi:DedD protein
VNESLKQRLVGGLILVALAVVFWPIIFIQPDDQGDAQLRSIPPRPEIDTTPLSAPDQVGLRASPDISAHQEEYVEETPEPDPPKQELKQEPDPLPQVEPPATNERAISTRSESPPPLKMDGDGVPLAWILQVVSVSSAEKADELRTQLLSMNHKAYVKKVSSGGRTLYRVYLGPKFERAKLEGLQAKIDTSFGVTSMIVRYTP